MPLIGIIDLPLVSEQQTHPIALVHSLCKRDRIMVKGKGKSYVKERERNDERLLAEDLFVYLIYLWQSGGDIEMVSCRSANAA